jgi:hypothetical protein
MSRPIRTLLCALMLLPVVAQSATPDSGTLSPTNLELKYTVGPAPLPNASGLNGLVPGGDPNYVCDTTNPCDEFALTLDLPADFLDQYPDTSVHVAAATDVEDFDIDLQVSDDKGVVASYRDNPPAQPSLSIFPAAGGTSHYVVQVVPGTPHTGASATVTLIPGDSVKSGPLAMAGALDGAALLLLAAFAGLRRRCRS